MQEFERKLYRNPDVYPFTTIVVIEKDLLQCSDIFLSKCGDVS